MATKPVPQTTASATPAVDAETNSEVGSDHIERRDEALALIDLNIAENSGHGSMATWDNTAVLSLLAEIRDLITGPDPEAPAKATRTEGEAV